MFQGTGALAFNAAFYLQQNPDVFQAIQNGTFQGSALDHFVQFGQFEGRDPNAFFDTEYYLANNTDVLVAIADPANPSVVSAFQHFVDFGSEEGVVRAPSAAFATFNAQTYLAQNPDLQDAFGDLEGEALEDALFAHFVEFGVNENRPGTGVDVDGPGVGGGQTFNLTGENEFTGATGIDNIVGTAGNDTINANVAFGNETLSSQDVIDGGAGIDTLNIADGAVVTGATPTIRNVEIINSQNADGLNLVNTTGVQRVNSVEGATFNNAQLATVFGLTEAGILNIDYRGNLAGDTTAQVAATLGATGTATFDFGTDAAAIENVVVSTAGTGTTTVALDTGLDALETITVNASNTTVITSVETTIETFDASGSTAGVTFTSGALAQNATITGGAGNDVLNFSAVADGDVDLTINGGAGNDIITGGAGDDIINGGIGNDILNGGAGNDTINGGAGNDIITGGAGADILTGGAGNDVFVYTAFADSSGTTRTTIDIITDFNASGNDTIDVSATTLATFVNAVDAIAVQNAVDGLAAGATLADALTAVDLVTDANEVASFTFGGNTYVYGDSGAADDLVIELSGVVAVTADDFIF